MQFLSNTPKQSTTVSREADEIIKQMPVVRVPPEQATDEFIIAMRAQFAEQEKGELAEMVARFSPDIKLIDIAGVKVYEITPKNIAPENQDKAILYIHGGGYVMGSATDRTGMLMTHELGLKTYAVDYQLAPEAKYPVALNECVAVYQTLFQQYAPHNLVGVSTSAGSTHMLAMALKAHQLGLPMMSAQVLLSPSVELEGLGDSWIANDNRDVLAWDDQFDVLYVKPFLGNADPKDPLVSPIYADYPADFSPTTIVSGTRDAFLSGSSRLFWKLREAGVDTELLVSEGMWHAFTNFADLPEAVQARKATQDFVNKYLGKCRG